jgi:N-acetylmuramoyl-L-alanine amidase
MAGCTSKRRSNLRSGAAVAALVLLAGVVSIAAGASSSTKTGAAKSSSEKTGSTASGKVTAVHFWSLGDVTRISIEVSSDFKYRWERLTESNRLYFDIQGARPALTEKGTHLIPVGDTLVKQIRIAETQPGVTRIVFDLQAHNPPVAFTASQLSSPGRLMVELRLAAPEKDKPGAPVTQAPLSALAPDLAAAPAVAAGAPPIENPELVAKPAPRRFRPPPVDLSISTPKPAPPVAQPRIDIVTPPALGPMASAKPLLVPPPNAVVFTPPGSPATQQAPSQTAPPAPSLTTPATPLPSQTQQRTPLPAKANASGDQSLTRALGLKLGRVVIDAGHGGNDVGTHGPSGLLEKDVTLDVALRLGALLQERLGTDVVYTRSDDSYVGLQQRTQIANDHRADLFLSIHANSSPYREIGGVETYYLNFTTTNSKAALELAAKENASSQSTIFDLKEVLAKIAMKDKIDESREFASAIQTSLFAYSSKNNAAVKNRGIKKAPFVVLIGATMPSVLAEIGFLTNSTDEAILKKPEQRQKIAEALYKGVASYADSLSHFQVAKRD